MRVFEKYAVRVGGGNNHRYNLSDGVMLKDNHIAKKLVQSRMQFRWQRIMLLLFVKLKWK